MVFLVFLLLLVPSISFAVPSISSVSISSGTVTVNGSSFGTKATAAPLAFSNFTSGTGTPSGWTQTENTTGGYSATQVRRGSKSLGFNYTVPSDNGTTGGRYTKDVSAQSQIYATAWVWISGTVTDSSGSAQFKAFRMSNNADGYTQGANSAWYLDTWYTTAGIWNNTALCAYTADSSTVCAPNAPSDLWLFGQWQRVETYVKASTTTTSNDGVAWMGRVGRSTLLMSSTSMDTYPTFRYFSVGVMGQRAQTLNVYYDSVYVDNTLARVEMCDSATWSTRSHCEIQPATAWATGAVSATYNPGTFVNGQTAYFYVVDSSGNASAAGSAYTVGNAELDISAPATTSNHPTGRYTTSQTATLACSDNVGCSSTTYCTSLTGNCTPGTTYTVPFKVLQNASVQYLCYRSTDAANNTEATKCDTLRKQKRR